MKIPRWKHWLSHLWEMPLESAASPLNPDLKLGLRRGQLCLSTPNAIYSYGDLYDNFSKSFNQINLGRHGISEVLILGFGLGSIPYMLENVFHKKYRYTGVEADEAIVHWASKYVLPGLASPVEIRMGDALVFAQTCERKFGLICMDIFLDNVVPEEFETIDFLQDLRRILSENGVLLFNRMTFGEADKKQALDFFEKKFRKVFPEGKYIDLGGNWMLVS